MLYLFKTLLPNATHNQNFIHHGDQNFIHREGEQREQLVVDVSGVVVTNERLFDVELFINSPNKDILWCQANFIHRGGEQENA